MLEHILPLLTFAFSITSQSPKPNETVLASREISLDKRYPSVFVNEVFKENILLNLAYMRGAVQKKDDIDWVKVTQPFTYTLVLKPGEIFAYQDDVLPEYEGKVTKTTNAHFNAQEGFKSSGLLFGDGVCHLASVIHWAAKDAGLQTIAPTRHDFAVIPQIPKEYGVSIYATPGKNASDQRQNLYIKNNKKKPIAFVFSYSNSQLKIDVKEVL